MSSQPLPLVGAAGSPYSRKLRAVLRYRRAPYVWIQQGSPESASLPKPKVQLLPQLIMKGVDGQRVARTDTTPLIRELEELVSNERSVIPNDPALALLDALIEDYADEWLTKAMFHYRWAFEADIAKAAAILPRGSASQKSDEFLAQAGKAFSKRQIDRLWVVGSNETTAPIIEESYLRFLERFEDHLRSHRFVLGERPGSCDFGLYGQLTQLALFDPTAMQTTLRAAPRVYAWTELVEDLSGLEPQADQWITREAIPETLRVLLIEIGRVYPPFLLGNAAALEAGKDRVECVIDGRTWSQKPFPYQGKCLQWLRRDYAALEEADRLFVDQTLQGTGLENLFVQPVLSARSDRVPA
ncbi:MAG: glutathione S-transferase [bacterium]|nr:glutathione S-transferase [Deltaproteobacteria bacterium]MCP4905228.1 glutathione S-transferase [bacterium]